MRKRLKLYSPQIKISHYFHIAWEDTKKWLLSSFIAWILAVIIPTGCAVLAAFLTPEGASGAQQAVWGAIGAIIGLCLFVIAAYLVRLIIIICCRRTLPKTSEDEYAQHKIVDAKAPALLAIPNTLRELSTMEAEFMEQMMGKKVRLSRLLKIQAELRKELRLKKYNLKHGITQEQQEDKLSKYAAKELHKLGVDEEYANEESVDFLLKVGWKLDKYNIGLLQKSKDNKQYKGIVAKLETQTANVASKEAGEAITLYKGLSYGFNSGYLFQSYFPLSHRKKVGERFYPEMSKFQFIREKLLSDLLQRISIALEDELHGRTK